MTGDSIPHYVGFEEYLNGRIVYLQRYMKSLHPKGEAVLLAQERLEELQAVLARYLQSKEVK